MSVRTKENLRASKLDPATWIPRKEAARILKVSLPTILSWAGPRFRVTEVKTKERIRWFVHAADVERVRLQRVGPTVHEVEAFVLSELAAGRTAREIVCAGRQITLGDVERIRDQDARLSGAFIVDTVAAAELRQTFNVETLGAASLVAQIRMLRQRVDLLSARLNGAALPPTSERP